MSSVLMDTASWSLSIPFIVLFLSVSTPLLLGGSLDVQQFRFFGGWTSEPLIAARMPDARERAEFDRYSAPRRLIKSVNDLDIDETLFTGRLRFPVLADTIREIDEFGSKLVAFLVAMDLLLAFVDQLHFHWKFVLIAILQSKQPCGAENFVERF